MSRPTFDPRTTAVAMHAHVVHGTCARCGVLTDTAIAYRPRPSWGLRVVCTKHLPRQGHTRSEQYQLLQTILNG